MGQGKAQRGGGDGHPVGGADPLDPGDPAENLRRRGLVVVEGAIDRPGRKDAGIVGAAQQNADAALLAQRQEALQSLLLQQRIAPGEEEEVEIPLARHALAHLPFVEPGPDGADHALLAQLDAGAVAAGHELTHPRVRGRGGAVGPDIDVVAQQHVDPVEPETAETGLERTHHPVIAVVVDEAPVRLDDELVRHRRFGPAFLEQATDLGGEDETVAGLRAQETPEPRLRQPQPVERRGVEPAHAGVPRRRQRRLRHILGDFGKEIAERRAATAELGCLQSRARGAVEGDAVHGGLPVPR